MIETRNLRLIPCELSHFEAILHHPDELEDILGATPAEDWLQLPESMKFAYDYLRERPHALGWWTYLIIHRKDKALIGTGGFAGPPGENGMVEIGYSIATSYRSRGLATEAAIGMVDYAFASPQIKMVDAHTLMEVNPSTRILEKIGMRKIGTSMDPDEGEVWHWRIPREDYDALRRER